MWWDNGIKPKGCLFEFFPVALDILHQFNAEIVEGKFVERDTFTEIFKV